MSYITAPAKIPLLLRAALFLAEHRLGRKLAAVRLLAWYPRLFVGSAVMEGLVAHDEPDVPRRLLGLIRISTSFLVSCPFCIDMNARELADKGITDDEIRAMQGLVPLDAVSTLSTHEKAALRYVECMCRTPLSFSADVIEDMRRHFSKKGIVIIAGTCAQVNYWARLVQALGVPPAGFSPECSILNLEAYATQRPAGSSMDFFPPAR